MDNAPPGPFALPTIILSSSMPFHAQGSVLLAPSLAALAFLTYLHQHTQQPIPATAVGFCVLGKRNQQAKQNRKNGRRVRRPQNFHDPGPGPGSGPGSFLTSRRSRRPSIDDKKIRLMRAAPVPSPPPCGQCPAKTSPNKRSDSCGSERVRPHVTPF
ncbi:uncharacterized protein J3D65DRAFT_273104 [Phyllosticta citribraziliensis]|uniref:Uncharacterized protein n=1 Tax=Phyllosticta citribraziliensis TaxID=989973 RepID=A0ABR1M1A5_9PEZI